MLFSGRKKPYWRYFAILANDSEPETQFQERDTMRFFGIKKMKVLEAYLLALEYALYYLFTN